MLLVTDLQYSAVCKIMATWTYGYVSSGVVATSGRHNLMRFRPAMLVS